MTCRPSAAGKKEEEDSLAPILPMTLSRRAFQSKVRMSSSVTQKRNVLGKLGKGSRIRKNLKTVPRCFLETKKSCTHTPCFPLGPIIRVPTQLRSLFVSPERERGEEKGLFQKANPTTHHSWTKELPHDKLLFFHYVKKLKCFPKNFLFLLFNVHMGKATTEASSLDRPLDSTHKQRLKVDEKSLLPPHSPLVRGWTGGGELLLALRGGQPALCLSGRTEGESTTLLSHTLLYNNYSIAIIISIKTVGEITV